MRAALRTAGAVVSMAGLIAVGLVFGENMAGATNQGEITIHPGEVLEKKFPTIPLPNPANQAHDPETCRTSLYCDTIRLNIVQPEDPDQGYFVQVQVSWATRAEQDVPEQGEMTDNDIDVFFYKVPYDTSNGKKDKDNEITSAATGAQPETGYVSAEKVDIVVVNFVGVNTEGYTVKIVYVLDENFTPVELLEDDSPLLEDLSDAVEAVVAPAPAPAPEPVVVAASPGLTTVGVDDPFGLSSGVTRSSSGVNLFRPVEAVAARPAKPVSAGVALLWLGAVPGALLGSVALFLAKRRKSAFGL